MSFQKYIFNLFYKGVKVNKKIDFKLSQYSIIIILNQNNQYSVVLFEKVDNDYNYLKCK